MTQRTRALIGLIASIGLLVWALAALALARPTVGGTIERAVPRATADPSNPVPTEPGLLRTGTRPGDLVARTSISPLDPGDLVDATRIEVPKPPRPPSRVSLPSIGVALPVEATGVSDDGQMELPEDPRRVGWYRFGAAPGDRRGAAVMAAHVDSFDHGVGPLAKLAALSGGDEVVVTGPGRRERRYTVREVTRYERADLPTEEVFATGGPHRLVLITCGGRFVGGATGYEDNIVVVASPVGRRSA